MSTVLIADSNETFTAVCASELAARNTPSVIAHSPAEIYQRLRGDVARAIVNLSFGDPGRKLWATLQARKISSVGVSEGPLSVAANARICQEFGLHACYEKPVNIAEVLKALLSAGDKPLPQVKVLEVESSAGSGANPFENSALGNWDKPGVIPGSDLGALETLVRPHGAPIQETRVLGLDLREGTPGSVEGDSVPSGVDPTASAPRKLDEKEVAASSFNDVLIWVAMIIGAIILWWAIQSD